MQILLCEFHCTVSHYIDCIVWIPIIRILFSEFYFGILSCNHIVELHYTNYILRIALYRYKLCNRLFCDIISIDIYPKGL